MEYEAAGLAPPNPGKTKKGGLFRPPFVPLGADNGIRTRDPRLGKPMLYQLSYVRICGAYYIGVVRLWQGGVEAFSHFWQEQRQQLVIRTKPQTPHLGSFCPQKALDTFSRGILPLRLRRIII